MSSHTARHRIATSVRALSSPDSFARLTSPSWIRSNQLRAVERRMPYEWHVRYYRSIGCCSGSEVAIIRAENCRIVWQEGPRATKAASRTGKVPKRKVDLLDARPMGTTGRHSGICWLIAVCKNYAVEEAV